VHEDGKSGMHTIIMISYQSKMPGDGAHPFQKCCLLPLPAAAGEQGNGVSDQEVNPVAQVSIKFHGTCNMNLRKGEGSENGTTCSSM
jgi:hypothetical protein